MYRRAVDDVVGDLKHRIDESLVGLDAVILSQTRTIMLHDESALRPSRYDDGVLHDLDLYQLQDLGSEVIRTISVSDSATLNTSVPQMTSFNARAVHVDLIERRRVRQAENLRAFELQGDIGCGRIGREEVVAAHGSLDHRENRSRDAIVGDVVDTPKFLDEFRAQLLGR